MVDLLESGNSVSSAVDKKDSCSVALKIIVLRSCMKISMRLEWKAIWH